MAGKDTDIIDLTDLLKHSLCPRVGGSKGKGSEKVGADVKGRTKFGASCSWRKAWGEPPGRST